MHGLMMRDIMMDMKEKDPDTSMILFTWMLTKMGQRIKNGKS